MIRAAIRSLLLRTVALRLRAASDLVFGCCEPLHAETSPCGVDLIERCAQVSGVLHSLARQADRLAQRGDAPNRRSAEEARSSGFQSAFQPEPIVDRLMQLFPELQLPLPRSRSDGRSGAASSRSVAGAAPRPGRADRQGDRRGARAAVKHASPKNASRKGAR